MKTVISLVAVSLLSFASLSVAYADDGVDLSRMRDEAFRSMDEMEQQARARLDELSRQSAENAQREADEARFRCQQEEEQRRLDALARSN